jgi:hypothetical protein
MLENFQKKKYRLVDNEIRNNSPYWNFSKFEIKFELKIKDALGFEFKLNLMKF